MTEFQELVKDAPKFVWMERGELVAYAYGMYAAVAKTDAENAKLRELVKSAWRCIHVGASCSDCRLIAGGCTLQSAMLELGEEVSE